MFIGRVDELKFLEERYQNKNGQLVILYGRRRVGKTEILRKFCEGKPHVFYACSEIPDESQLHAFSERMLQKGMPAANYVTHFQSWQQALGSVADLPGDGKKLLIIDEFPYMVRGNRAIPSILQNLWDEKQKNENIMIILCGSAMSFIEKDILAEKNPLYGRATGILKMQEMDFFDARQFMPRYSPLDQIAAYAVLGGIPHYLNQFDDHLSLPVNIKRQILTRGSILYSEVEFLMRQELRETATYNAIIEAVALGNTQMNEIYQKTLIEKNKLSVYLKNLIDLRILRREFPVADGIKEQANIHRGLYQVTDPYFRFWYAFVFPNVSELETGDVDGIWSHVIEPAMNQFISPVFEDICRQYLRRANRKNTLPFHFTKIGRWWNKTDEIDILATDSSRRSFLLGECKFKSDAFARSDLEKLQSKFTPKAKNSQIQYWLFSKSGFTDDVLKRAESDRSIQTVTINQLVMD